MVVMVQRRMRGRRPAESKNRWVTGGAFLLVASLIGVALGPGAMVVAEGQGDPPQYPLPHFVDVAEEAGLDFACGGWNRHIGLAPRFFIDLFHCTDPVVADFNGNGYLDVFFPNMRHTNATMNTQNDPQNRLYLNNGDGTFSDVTDILGLRDDAMSLGAAAVDFDGNGHLDIYVANFVEIPRGFQDMNSPSTSFYQNHGDGTFSLDVPPGLVTGGILGGTDNQWGMAVSVADYDGDGYLDIYRGNWVRYRITDGMPPGVQATQPDTNNLYRNNADGTFEEVTHETGTSLFEGRSFGVSFADFTSNGLPDLYVANDLNPNEFYRNQGDGVFDERSFDSGANDARGSMCAQAADWSGNGHLDLYMTHYENQQNGYYIGHGDGTFTEASELGDLPNAYAYVGWGCPAVDVNNDGALDLFIANGHMLPTGSQFPGNDLGYAQQNHLFLNTLRQTGEHSFVDITNEAGPGLQDELVSGGATAADFDLDGRAEILVANSDGKRVSLYKNQAETVGNWILIEPRMDAPNTHAIGAKVTLTVGEHTLVDKRITGGGYGGGSVLPLRFGLGAHDGPVEALIDWPDGTTTSHTLDEVNMPVRIHQTQGVELDTLAPGVDVLIDGQAGENGWWVSPEVTVTLDAEDRGIGHKSGLDSVSYRIGDGLVQEYTGPFTISGDGVHDIMVYASDLAGNNAWYPHRIKIDSTPPEGALTRPVEGMLYIQDEEQGPSPTGQTTIITPVRTPNEDVQDADDFVEGTIRTINDMTGFGLPGPGIKVLDVLDEAGVTSDQYTLVLADAFDETSGVDRVVFQLNSEPLRTDRAEPYVWKVDLRGQPHGEHELSITAYDRAGLSVTDTLTLYIVPSTQDGVMNTLMELIND